MLLVALGLYFRLDGALSSLWLDEFGTLWTVEGDFRALIVRCLEFQGQTPFYYVFPWLAVRLLGESEAALRAPSLVFGACAAFLVFLAAGATGGRWAACVAALLFWFSPIAVQTTVEARPYSLVLLATAVAVYGFARSVMVGDRAGRALWIAGATGVAWSHYAQYPVIMGLYLAYVFLPVLRQGYAPVLFARDAAVHILLVAPSVPQFLNLLGRRSALSWIGTPNYLALALSFLPLLLPICLDLSTNRAWTDRRTRALRQAWLVSAASHLLLLQGTALAGVNLLHPRYALAALVPVVLLAGTALTRLGRRDVVAALVCFVVASGPSLGGVKRLTGSFSGLGRENWRDATDCLAAYASATHSVILYRSGFVEQDLEPIGEASPVNLAPLRSPGRPPFPWRVTSLTYRWSNPARATYFESHLVPLLSRARSFCLFGLLGGPETRSYADAFVGWTAGHWPGVWKVDRRAFGTVELVEFVRLDPGRGTGAPR